MTLTMLLFLSHKPSRGILVVTLLPHVWRGHFFLIRRCVLASTFKLNKPMARFLIG
jgi:hypothetical protein